MRAQQVGMKQIGVREIVTFLTAAPVQVNVAQIGMGQLELGQGCAATGQILQFTADIGAPLVAVGIMPETQRRLPRHFLSWQAASGMRATTPRKVFKCHDQHPGFVKAAARWPQPPMRFNQCFYGNHRAQDAEEYTTDC